MRYPKFFRSHPAAKRRTARGVSNSSHHVSAQIEQLEQRELLSGLNLLESVFDSSQFASNLEEQVPVDSFGGNGVVGYSYAIVDGDPNNPITGAGGNAVMPWDGFLGTFSLPSSAQRRQEIASISKAVTGAAIMHVLQEKILQQDPNPAPGELKAALETKLDEFVSTYLPSNWAPSANFSTITLRELLTHSSGLRRNTSTTNGWITTATLLGGGFSGGANTYNYLGLQQISELGNVDMSKPTEYWTTNFAYFRVMLPYMWDDVPNAVLDFNAATGLLPLDSLPADLIDDIMDDWDLTPIPELDLLFVSSDQLTSFIYKHYVSKYIMEPSGVNDAETQTTGVFPTLLYPMDPTIVPGTGLYPPLIATQVAGLNTGDQTLNEGSRGWNLSAIEVAQFLSGVRHGATDGTTILEDETLELMDAQGLGWQLATLSSYVGDFGQYYGHNGINFRAPLPASAPANSPSLAPMNNTVAIAFPNGVEASLLINSQLGPQFGAALNLPGANTSTNAAMLLAYDHAWTEIVYDGNSDIDVAEIPAVFSANDVFTIRQNPTNPAYIDVLLGGAATVTRRIDTLSKITLNGLDGFDTFNIQFLPGSIELVINGGNGNDTVNVTPTNSLLTPSTITLNGLNGQDTFNIQSLPGNIELIVNGGFGNDTVNVTPISSDLDDIDGNITIDGGSGIASDEIVLYDENDLFGDNYTITSTTFDKTGFPILNYENISVLDLRGNDYNNTFTVNSLADGVALTIHAGDGDDVGVIGGAASDLDSTVLGSIHWKGGNGMDLLKFNDGSDNFGDDSYTFSSNTFTKAGLDTWDFIQTEDVVLNASPFSNTINIDSFGTFDLLINAFLGDDTINIGNGLVDLIDGDVHVNGSLGTNTININDQDAPGGRTYTFAEKTFDMSFVTFGSLSYTSIDDVVLNAGDSNDVIYALSSSPSTDLHLNGNDGNDAFNVGNGDLDAIGGAVNVVGGSGFDLVTINDQNDVGDNPYSIDSNSVTKPTFDLGYSEVESLTLYANPFNNVISVESTAANTPVIINAGAGSDTIEITPATKDLANLLQGVFVNGQSGVDNVIVHDENNIVADAPYTITANIVSRAFAGHVNYATIERLALHAGNLDSTITIESTNPDTLVYAYGNGGEDTFNVIVPALESVTLDGGGQDDVAVLTGTAGDDEISISTGLGDAHVNFIDVETGSLDALGGTDVLVYQGIAGMDEDVQIHASTTPNAGSLIRPGVLDLVFANTEILDLLANLGDADTATFIGTVQDDEFNINLSAEGTNDDPVLQLINPASQAALLTLRDYRNFNTLAIEGGDGVDVFNVFVAPAGPGVGRNLSIDGGDPAGMGNGKDELNVFFEAPPAPDFDHDKDNQDNSGTFDVLYPLHQFFIEYTNIEKALAKSDNAF